MSNFKNPFESLQDYFDELLATNDDNTAVVAAEVVVPAPIKAAQPAPAALGLVARPEPHFADPELEQQRLQKEKLQKLLQSAQPKIAVAPVAKVEAPAVKPFIPDPNEIQDWTIEVAAPVVEVVEAPPSLEEDTASQGFQLPGLEWLPNGLPQWAQSRFDVLLFKVSGLTLAVPLIALGQIQPLTDELTPLFGQADWFMGLQPTPQGKIRTVNTAKFVMPERYDEKFLETAKYVVSINGVPWGLAVDSVNQPISLMPDEVKWRSDRSKRPWLAGTVKEHMCALLDIPMIGQMLIDADKNAMKSRI